MQERSEFITVFKSSLTCLLLLLLLMDLFMELLCSFFLFDANTNGSWILTLTLESCDQNESCCFLFFDVVSFLSGAYCIDVAMVI